MDRHYPKLYAGNRTKNIKWTQGMTAKRQRAYVLTFMPDVLAESPLMDTTHKRVVRMLKDIGLLAPNTAAVDVRVDAMVSDAKEILKEQSKRDSDYDALVQTAISLSPEVRAAFCEGVLSGFRSGLEPNED